MEIRVLGPVELELGGQRLRLGGPKQRALLSLLALNANLTVSVDRLIEGLWGEEPPASAAKMVQLYVSQLRKLLAEEPGAEIVTHGRGYELRLDREAVDAARFERLVAEASRGDHNGAAGEAAHRALGLWRGPPLADLMDEPFAAAEARRLDELHLVALELALESDLEAGLCRELIGPLDSLVAEYPLRERLHGLRILALYRCERQADALQAYQDARRTLVDELGIEPGEHLRELERAILAQDPGLAAPELETAEPSRVPAPPNRTFGREQDQEAVAQLLRQTDVRLVTLTGPGGVGKTRLALEAARRLEPELRDGGWFVSLAATANAEHLPSAIALALDVTPLEGESPKRAVERFLAPKHALLVLDNFEHLLPGAPLIGDLLAAAPALVVLATSREALRLQPEYRYAVASLHVPAEADPAAVAHAAASSLFVERARRHDPGFQLTQGNAGSVAEICRHLDGLPLAIELAAARTALLSVDELNARLAHALDALGAGPRDAPARQRTLRATIDWSHDLLNAREADAFARFAVFAGGATIEAAQAVTGGELDALQGLVDKQLLLRPHGSSPDARLLMLKTVRDYARERLDALAAAPQTHERHCRHYLALAERAEPELFTRGEGRWLLRLDAEVHNLRAAPDWSLRHGDPRLAVRLAGLLPKFWAIRNLPDEGLEWIKASLDAAGNAAPLPDRARARRAQGLLLQSKGAAYDAHGLMKEARAKAAKALELSRREGDPAGIADALLVLAGLEMAETLPQRRRRALAEEALSCAAKAGDDRLVALALTERALAVPLEQGAAELEQAAAALRKIGSSRYLVGLYSSAAYNAIKAGTPERARPLLDRARPLARELGDPLLQAFVWATWASRRSLPATSTGPAARLTSSSDCAGSTCSG